MKTRRFFTLNLLVTLTLLLTLAPAGVRPGAAQRPQAVIRSGSGGPPFWPDPISNRGPARPPFSTTDAENVEFVAQIGGATDGVAVQGNYAYIGEGPRLTILDISNPTSPAVIGKTAPLPGIVGVGAVVGNYAYVSAGGLCIIDVSNPAAPREVGFYEHGGDIAVAGNYAYVAAGESGLRIINIANPAAPSEVGVYDMPGEASVVAVTGNYAYVGETSVWDGSQLAGGGLRVINVANPAAPSEANYCEIKSIFVDVAVAGPYAYLVDGEFDNLLIFNISDPASVYLCACAIWDMPGSPESVAVSGDHFYVANQDGLLIMEVSDPDPEHAIGYYETPGEAEGVAVAGNFAYVEDGDGLRVIDVTNPAAPTETGSYDAPWAAGPVAVAGDYAYVVDSDLRIIGVANPATPSEVGFYETPGNARDVAVVGDYAYIADEDSLRIIDVANPTVPTEVGFYDGAARDVAVVGNYAYVLGGDALRIIDVTNPAAPTGVGSCDVGGRRVAVAGNYAYVAGGWESGLRIIDVADPAAPTEIGSYTMPAREAEGVAVAGDYAYVADWTYRGYEAALDETGLHIINVADPTAPTEVGFFYTPGRAKDVAVAGNPAADAGQVFAYVADSDSLRIMDVTDPTVPTEAGFFDTYGAGDVAVACDYIYVADGDGGLYILRYDVSHCISGRAADEDGKPIEGVQVSAGSGYSAMTDANGQYTVISLPTGTYTLTPAAPGYFWSPASRTVAVPPDAIGQDFTGYNIEKSVNPGAPYAVDYGDTLSYTVRLVYPDDRTLALYDRPPTYTTYLSGSLSGPVGVVYDAAANVISGTLNLAAGDPETVTFAVRVGVTGTVGFAPLIVNRACVYPAGEGLERCTWSNEVLSFTYAWPVYLPLVVRNH